MEKSEFFCLNVPCLRMDWVSSKKSPGLYSIDDEEDNNDDVGWPLGVVCTPGDDLWTIFLCNFYT